MDVILGMSWMIVWKAVMDTANRTLTLSDSRNGNKLCVLLPRSTDFVDLTCAIKVEELAKIFVVCDFPDVFPDELPGLPPKRAVDFAIELMPGTTPISRRPYRMPPNELVELKNQLKELLDKGFIQPSTSEWGCPALFVKKDQSL